MKNANPSAAISQLKQAVDPVAEQAVQTPAEIGDSSAGLPAESSVGDGPVVDKFGLPLQHVFWKTAVTRAEAGEAAQPQRDGPEVRVVIENGTVYFVHITGGRVVHVTKAGKTDMGGGAGNRKPPRTATGASAGSGAGEWSTGWFRAIALGVGLGIALTAAMFVSGCAK
jgi:hypothetical protein